MTLRFRIACILISILPWRSQIIDCLGGTYERLSYFSMNLQIYRENAYGESLPMRIFIAIFLVIAQPHIYSIYFCYYAYYDQFPEKLL